MKMSDFIFFSLFVACPIAIFIMIVSMLTGVTTEREAKELQCKLKPQYRIVKDGYDRHYAQEKTGCIKGAATYADLDRNTTYSGGFPTGTLDEARNKIKMTKESIEKSKLIEVESY